MRQRDLMAVAAVAVILLAGLGHIALLDPDEGRYAASARDMLQSGDYVVPTFNGEVRLNKPPLLYWLIAACFAVLPQAEAAARLPSAMAGLLTAALAGWWAGRRLGPDRRLPAMVALAATPILFACARLATPDMLLAACTTAGLLFWHEAAHASLPAARRRFAAAAAVAGGLAFLAKGPVGPLLPAFVILVYSAIERRPGLVTLMGRVTAGAGLLLVAGPWCAALASRIGLDGAMAILRREALDRALTGADHPRPFWYLLATFWALFLPWSLAMPAAVWRAVRSPGPIPGPCRFLAVWLGVVLLFFSLLPGKNDAYLLPVAPAVALLAAWRLPPRWTLAAAGVMALVLVSAVFAWGGRLSERRSVKQAAVPAGLSSLPPDTTLLSYKLYKPSLVFYAGRPARWLTSEKELEEALGAMPAGRGAAILMLERRREQVAPLIAEFREIHRGGGYLVLLSP